VTRKHRKGNKYEEVYKDHWFCVGIESGENKGKDPHAFEDKYPYIREIAEKYGFEY